MKKDSNKLCQCECGKPAPIAKYTYKKRGWKLGEPKTFIHGHNRTGISPVTPPMLGKRHSLETRNRMRASSRKGEKSNLWKGGLYKENELARRSSQYRLWRQAVYERDDYTCQICRERGGELNADHIKPWALYPELRYDINNGRTLCVYCHRKTDTYAVNLRYYREVRI